MEKKKKKKEYISNKYNNFISFSCVDEKTLLSTSRRSKSYNFSLITV